MVDLILVPLDGSRLAECVLPHAVAVARAFGARITVLHVMQSGRSRSTDPLGWHVRKVEAQAYLKQVVGRLQKVGLSVDDVFLEGQAAERVVKFAHEEHVDLIILSSHGRSGLSMWNISSVVQKIILRAYTSTMIVRAYRPGEKDLEGVHYRRLLLPLDGSQRAECVLPLAVTLAHSHESQLLLARVVRKPEFPHRFPLTREEMELRDQVVERNRREASRHLEELHSQLKVDAQTRLLVSDDAPAALHRLVEEEEIDLVLLSAHGYTGTPRWPYGSMALNFITFGTTPLLMVQDLSEEEVAQSQAEIATRERKGH
jgi:nucleotide-binding universal stress UspA family protein